MIYSDEAFGIVCRRFQDMVLLMREDDPDTVFDKVVRLAALAGVPAESLPLVLQQLEELIRFDGDDPQHCAWLEGAFLGVTFGLLTASEERLSGGLSGSTDDRS